MSATSTLREPALVQTGTDKIVFIPELDACGPFDAWLSELQQLHVLAVGAHADDAVFLALPWIAEGRQNRHRRFAAVTCTNGRGSIPVPPYDVLPKEEIADIRRDEEMAAAKRGLYAAAVMLGYDSSDVKKPLALPLVEDLARLLIAARPDILVTHQPLDDHETHRGVFRAVIEAVRRVRDEYQPKALYVLEVWGHIPPPHRQQLDVTDCLELARDLLGSYPSQLAAKDYAGEAVHRWTENAVFWDPHKRTIPGAAWMATLDLSALIRNPDLPMGEFVWELLRQQFLHLGYSV